MIEAAKQRPNTIVDPSGFVLTTLEEGTGKKVKEGDDVQAHYVLSLSNGEVIQNSYMTSAQGNQPAPSFSLNSVVKGWQLAIPKMREGGRDRKSTRLNSSHVRISYAVFCLKKKKKYHN